MLKEFKYLIVLFICYILYLGCDQIKDDNQVDIEHLSEVDTILESLEEAVENWNEEYLHDELIADPKISDISVNGSTQQKYRLALILGQYYLNMGLFETAIDKLLPVCNEIEQIDTPIKYQIYNLLERCYSYNSDAGNRASILTDLTTKMDYTVLSDSLEAWVQYMAASYYASIDSVSQRNDYLDKAKIYIDKWNIHDLKLMSRLLPLIHTKTNSVKEEKEILELVKKLEPLVPMARPYYQNIYYSNLGDFYWSIKDFTQTLDVTLKEVQSAYAVKNKFKRNKALGSSLINLADAYINISDYKAALEQLDTAHQYISFTRYRTRIPYYWNRIAIFDKLGYPIDSTEKVFYEMARESNDHLKEKSAREIEALNEIKLEENSLIREKNTLLRQKLILQRNFVITSAFLVALCLIFLLFFQRYRIKVQRQETLLLKMRNKLLTGQLNPHFLHNSLYSVMLNVEEKVPFAYEYLGKLSKMLRHIFSYYQSDEAPLKEELTLLENYFYLEQTKLENRELLSLQINVDPNIDTENTLIIPLLMQTILENSIKYRLHNKMNTIEVNLSKSINSNILECVFKDTGKGLDNELVKFNHKHSLYFIKRYIDSLSQQSMLSIAPRKDTRGVIVKLHLPYKIKSDD